MSDPDREDPEAARFAALLAAQRRGTATDAEREELALYAEGDAERQAAIATNDRVSQLGRGWLDRVERDTALRKVDTGRRAQIERTTGLAVAIVGYLVSFPLPLTGIVITTLGVLLVLYSLIRVRLAAHHSDPYKDVQR